jgi:hypothetical protein
MKKYLILSIVIMGLFMCFSVVYAYPNKPIQNFWKRIQKVVVINEEPIRVYIEPKTKDIIIFDNACSLKVGDVSQIINIENYASMFLWVFADHKDYKIRVESSLDNVGWWNVGNMDMAWHENYVEPPLIYNYMERNLNGDELRLKIMATPEDTSQCLTAKLKLSTGRLQSY